jgi:hypothetical protein
LRQGEFIFSLFSLKKASSQGIGLRQARLRQAQIAASSGNGLSRWLSLSKPTTAFDKLAFDKLRQRQAQAAARSGNLVTLKEQEWKGVV